MVNTSADLLNFYNDQVTLPEGVRPVLRKHRDENRERLRRGLLNNAGPSIRMHIPQGSYAMHTMIWRPNNDFDIDDGAVFDRADLFDAITGSDMSPSKARQMVCDALGEDQRFSAKPKVKKNCVRVYYADGHHVDIPVYRRFTARGTEQLELAGEVWRESDPRLVTNWFNREVETTSPDMSHDGQMRRMVCLLKNFAGNRTSWKAPSGFILSVLVSEVYIPFAGRDDEAWAHVVRGIRDRLLRTGFEVSHPIVSEKLTKSSEDPVMVGLLEHLEWGLERIADVENAGDRIAALKGWKAFFGSAYSDYFEGLIGSASAAERVASGGLYGIAATATPRAAERNVATRFG